MKIEELRTRLEELNQKAKDIVAQADEEKRDLSEEDRKDLDQTLADFEACKGELERREKLEEQTATLTQGTGRKTLPNQLAPRDEEIEPARKPTSRLPVAHAEPISQLTRGRYGWNSLGEFAGAVKQASVNGGNMDPRLAKALATPTTYGNEGVGADGGFAVPPDFRNEIMIKVVGEESLVGRTNQLTSSSNSVTIPKDETTPWQTSGGVLATWETEGGLKAQSKPSFEATTVRLNKLTCLVPVTDELIEDAPMLDGYLRRKAPEKIGFKVNLAIIQGTGVGQPLGILNAASTVSVAKETSQPADTIYAANIFKMWSRMYGPWRSNAVWLINQDIEPQLFQMTIPIKNVAGTENVGGSVVYLPANGLSSSPFATLMGRPVIPSQAMETLGDLGDIMFVDLNQYLTIVKTGGVRAETSIHLWFDYDITAFRFVLRIGGQPWWTSAISPRDGSTTMGPAVVLAERA